MANDAWPSDGVEVSESVFIEYTQSIPEGKKRGCDEKGRPAWVDIPPPTPEELSADNERKKSRLKSYATAVINDNQWPSRLALGRLSEEEKAAFNTWIDYLAALESLDTSSAPGISWPAQPVG